MTVRRRVGTALVLMVLRSVIRPALGEQPSLPTAPSRPLGFQWRGATSSDYRRELGHPDVAGVLAQAEHDLVASNRDIRSVQV